MNDLIKEAIYRYPPGTIVNTNNVIYLDIYDIEITNESIFFIDQGDLYVKNIIGHDYLKQGGAISFFDDANYVFYYKADGIWPAIISLGKNTELENARRIIYDD